MQLPGDQLVKTRIPCGKRTSPSHFTLRGFFRCHNEALIIAGAIIVFLAFTVKEELRDRGREWRDLLQNGRRNVFRATTAVKGALYPRLGQN